MTSQNDQTLPKYACPACGSDEIRGEPDSYPVFLAEDDKIVYLRSESYENELGELSCNECNEPIEVDDFGTIEIE